MFLIVVAAVAACLLCGCSDGAAKPTKNKVTVTLLNGEHYSVIGNNKVDVVDGQPVSFDIRLEKGYDVVGHYGDGLRVSVEPSFIKKVTFAEVQYKTVARLETLPLDMVDFKAVSKDANYGDISVETVLGEAEQNAFYENDVLDISVTPNDGYRFLCWSTGNFLSDGGEFFSYESRLTDFDFNAHSILYANFKDITNTENTIYYRFEDGVEIEQDCTALLAHHARANTLTAAEVTAQGIDFDGKMLAGWQTKNGSRVGLGSRVTVDNDEPTMLYPIWKDFSPEKNFTVSANGKLTKFDGIVPESGEIVVPREVNGIAVTTIGAKAFENSKAHTYYLPDTVVTVENDAFLNCAALTDFYMSDNIMKIDDKAFIGCKNFTTLHLNAVLKPRYNNDTSVKLEVYDRLIANVDNEQQKLVMLADSNMRFGYSDKVINELFEKTDLEKPQIYNLAVAADMGLYCQYEMCKPYLREGDIFLHAPAEREGSWFGYYDHSPITNSEKQKVNYRIFNVTECNWDLLSHVTVSMYSNIFSQLSTFNNARKALKELEYADYYRFVEDDKLGVRESTEFAVAECGVDKSFGSNGNIRLTNNREKHIIDIRDSMYKYFNENGIKLFVTFGTINRHNLLRTYNDEQTLKTAADAYTDYVKSLLSEVDCTILLTQYDTIYDGRHFSNSDLHLGDPFRNEHTKKIMTAMIDKLLQDNNHGGGV